MRARVSRERRHKIVGPAGLLRLPVKLLRLVAAPSQIVIRNTWSDFVGQDCERCRSTHVNFAAVMGGRKDNCVGGDFRLEDRRDWPGFVRQTAAHPSEL